MKFFQYLDLGLLMAGSILVTFGLAQLGLAYLLVGGGVALITMGLWGHK